MEYAGYVRRGAPTDWSKVTGGIAQRLSAVEESREKEREKLDKLFTETTKIVGDVEMGMNPEFNETILYTADRGRQLVYDAYKKLKNGQIQPREYRNIQNNVQARWAEYDTAVKQKNSRFATIEERTRKGTNSERELWQNQQIAEMESFKDYSLEWGSDGNLVYAKRDDKGNIIPGSIMPISALNKTPNVLVDRFNLTEKVGKYKKNFGAFKIEEGGYILGGSAVDDDKLEAAKKVVIGSIFTTDNDYGDALIDSTYDAFALYKEGAEVPEGTTDDGVALGIKMIFDKQSSTWTAVPTDKQKAYIREKAGEAIDTMLGYQKVKVTKKTDPGYDKKTERLDASYDAYLRANEVLNGKNLNDIIGNKVGGPGGKTIVNAYTTEEGTVVVVKGAGQKAQAEALDPITSAEGAMKFVSSGGKGAKGTQSELDNQYNEGKAEYEKREGKLKMEKEAPEEADHLPPISDYKDSDDIKQKAEYTRVINKYKRLQDYKLQTQANRNTIEGDIKKEIIANLKSQYISIKDDQIKIVFIKSSIGNYDRATVQVGKGAAQEIELDFAFAANREDAEKMDAAITTAINSYIDEHNKTLTSGGGKDDDPLDIN